MHYLLLCTFCVSITLLFPVAQSATAQPLSTTAARVIDGDTLVIGRERIRLHGIDAPERGQPCQAPDGERDCGAIARLALLRLVSGRRVTCEALGRGRYGRIIARCGTPTVTDLGQHLVRHGIAFAAPRYSRDYVAYEALARSDRRGLWAMADVARPHHWRQGRRDPDARTRIAEATRVCLPAPRCAQLPNCAAARFQLTQCGALRLDGDEDGTPCEALCRGGEG